jgi:Mn-dependent DtxR family transcriptional regulator
MEEMQKFHTVRGYQLLEQTRKLLTPSMEDYLEMIYRKETMEGYLRINTLSELLNVSAPSVTRMVQKMDKLGLVDYKRYGMILLTDNGKEIGKFLLLRHNIIEAFMKNFCLKESLLVETELIEHSISVTTLQRFNDYNKFLEQNPEIIKKFEQFSQYNIG